MTYLADSQMAEPTDQLLLVEGICSHFHSSHGRHVLVHFEQTLLCHLHLQAWGLCAIRTERVFMKSDGERLGVVCVLSQLGGVCSSLQSTEGEGLL